MDVVHYSRLAFNYGTGVLALRPEDVWFASFPRTGSTWLRFILCNVISLQEMDGADVDFHMVDDVIPALGRPGLFRPWTYQSMPRLVKTHQPYRRGWFARPERAVYVMRDPRDAMVSYFNFLERRSHLPFHGSFADLIRHRRYGLEAMLINHVSWAARKPIVMRFDEMKADPVGRIDALLRQLGTPAPREILEKAVERASFQKIREAQRETGIPGKPRFREGFEFARSGKVGQWSEWFTDEDLALYAQLRERYDFHLYP
jgi:estrone sulfotransferase